MSDLVARNGGRAGTAALAAILLVALGLRVGEAWDGRPPVYDAAAYAAIAANLAEGDGFTVGEEATQPSGNYSPGLPLAVAALYEATGGVHERLARLVLAALGTLGALFAYLIGRRLSGPLAGLVAAGVVAIYPALLEYQGMLMGEPLAATLLAGAILAMLWAAGPATTAPRAGGMGQGGVRTGESANPPLPHDRTRAPACLAWLVPGLLLGALALVRPEYLGISVLLAVVAGAQFWGEWRRGALAAALLLAGVAVVVAPWTARNAVALDRFVPISTGGGQVLFAGAYLPSGGDPERVGEEVLKRHPGLTAELAGRYPPPRSSFYPPRGGKDEREAVAAVLDRVRLEQILAALAAERYPGIDADRALSRLGRERLREAVTEEPIDYAGFLAAKVWRVWGHGAREIMRDPPWAVLHWVLLALALGGAVLLARRRSWGLLPIAVVLLAATTIGALLVATPRRALVTVPLLAALAGVAVAWLTAHARDVPLVSRPYGRLTNGTSTGRG